MKLHFGPKSWFWKLSSLLDEKDQVFWGATEIEPESNDDDVIITLKTVLNIYKNIKLIKNKIINKNSTIKTINRYFNYI